MYVCGITVYDYLHLGHARFMVVFDMVRRWLRASGYRVTYVRNITDIDDKIIRRALENGESTGELTTRFIRCIDEDAAALGVQKPDHEPRATRYVPQMVDMIGRLEEKKLAYRSASGDVNFAVRRFPGYGKLSGKSLDELRAGERVAVDASKEDPLDFVLWKRSKPDEPKWPSRWGEGRPGWHIECSAMSWKHLGETFDIHGGGIDLVFPHHENEIAQSRCAFHTRIMANFWMHNGFLQVEGEKMSKSLGNFFTIRDVLADWPAEAVRLAMLQTHYRQPINWTEAGLREAQRTLDHWYQLTAEVGPGMLCADVVDALSDDLNTPKALAAFHELRAEAAKGTQAAAACLKASARLMGLLQHSAAEWAAWRPRSLAIDEGKVEALIAARNAARQAKNFKEADRIRAELDSMGIELEDHKDRPTTWKVKR